MTLADCLPHFRVKRKHGAHTSHHTFEHIVRTTNGEDSPWFNHQFRVWQHLVVVSFFMCFWGRCQVQTPQLNLLFERSELHKNWFPADFAGKKMQQYRFYMDHFRFGLLINIHALNNSKLCDRGHLSSTIMLEYNILYIYVCMLTLHDMVHMYWREKCQQ